MAASAGKVWAAGGKHECDSLLVFARAFLPSSEPAHESSGVNSKGLAVRRYVADGGRETMNSSRYESYAFDGPSLYLTGQQQQQDVGSLHSIVQASPLVFDHGTLRVADEQQSSDCSGGSSPDRWAASQTRQAKENGETDASPSPGRTPVPRSALFGAAQASASLHSLPKTEQAPCGQELPNSLGAKITDSLIAGASCALDGSNRYRTLGLFVSQLQSVAKIGFNDAKCLCGRAL